MREVVLQIPTLESEQNIDIEVKINGKKRTMHYRVEIIAWEDYDGETADKVDVIKRVIREYDRAWQLIEIGMPMALAVLQERQSRSSRYGWALSSMAFPYRAAVSSTSCIFSR